MKLHKIKILNKFNDLLLTIDKNKLKKNDRVQKLNTKLYCINLFIYDLWNIHVVFGK